MIIKNKLNKKILMIKKKHLYKILKLLKKKKSSNKYSKYQGLPLN